MIVVEDMPLAIILMLLSLLCLGSWPLFFNILERRGRLPQHTYLDYAVTNFVVGSLFALLLGQLGQGTLNAPNFITQLQQVRNNFLSYTLSYSNLSNCFSEVAAYVDFIS